MPQINSKTIRVSSATFPSTERFIKALIFKSYLLAQF